MDEICSAIVYVCVYVKCCDILQEFNREKKNLRHIYHSLNRMVQMKDIRSKPQMKPIKRWSTTKAQFCSLDVLQG